MHVNSPEPIYATMNENTGHFLPHSFRNAISKPYHSEIENGFQLFKKINTYKEVYQKSH